MFSSGHSGNLPTQVHNPSISIPITNSKTTIWIKIKHNFRVYLLSYWLKVKGSFLLCQTTWIHVFMTPFLGWSALNYDSTVDVITYSEGQSTNLFWAPLRYLLLIGSVFYTHEASWGKCKCNCKTTWKYTF